ncbi:hypothetical protein ACTQ6A_15795 [Lachnospiraceae bacterium LCP25S3_G4]
MKKDNSFFESTNMLNKRLDNIESLLKLLLVNNLVDDLKNECVQVSNLSNESKKLITEYGFEVENQQEINGTIFTYITVPVNKKFSTKDILKIDSEVKLYEIKPIYLFENLNGMQRKKLIQEDISFCIIGRETHICERS